MQCHANTKQSRYKQRCTRAAVIDNPQRAQLFCAQHMSCRKINAEYKKSCEYVQRMYSQLINQAGEIKKTSTCKIQKTCERL